MRHFYFLFGNGIRRGISRKLRLLSLFVLLSLTLLGQAPAGYYDAAEGKNGADLKTALCNIITNNHQTLSYSSLGNYYPSTDATSDGKVWDMYSSQVYTFSQNGSSANQEGQGWNKEHSFPQSWFKEASPMKADLFHVYPTDIKVNSIRSNFPFGKVGGSPSFTSTNGCKLGSSDSNTGYSGTVFEPADEYKGDFARTYFYMATRYEKSIDSWTSNGTAGQILDGTEYPVFKSWYKKLMLEWHHSDPVSPKEVTRNNAVYAIQKNRNPFIDNPSYADMIWGDGPIGLTFTSSPVTSAQAGTAYTYNITVTGAPGATFTITAPTLPNSWLTFTPTGNGTATLTGTPTAENAGDNNVVLIGSDGTKTVEQSFTIKVVKPNTGSGTIETFENMPNSSSSYLTRNWVGDNNIAWTATKARTDQTINNRAVCFDKSGTRSLESQTINGECSKISFKHYNPFSTTGGTITLYVNNTEIGSVNPSSTVQTSSFTVDISGSFIIKLTIEGTAQTAIDDLEWQSTNQDPEITSVSTIPLAPVTGQSIAISAEVDDADGTVQSVTMNWGTSSDNLVNTASMSANDDVYTTTIPSQANTGTIYYRITAVDNLGGTVAFNSSVIIAENKLPLISNITISPENPVPSTDVTISAKVEDPEERLQSVVLKWGIASNSLTNSVTMSNSSSIYTGVVPAQIAGQTIYYQIVADDAESNRAVSSILNYLVGSGSTNQLPIITNVTTNPENTVAGQNISISANIVDADGSISKVVIDWGTSSGAMDNSLEMSKNNNTYSVSMPGNQQSGIIYYRISAIDNSEGTSYYNNSITILANQLPSISNITLNPSSPTSADAIIVSANVTDPEGRLGSALVQWSVSENTLKNQVPMTNTASSFSATIPAQASGSIVYYRLKAVDAEGNEALSIISSFTVNSPNSIDDVNKGLDVFAYPNPFYNELNIKVEKSSGCNVEILDIIGRVLYQNDFTNGIHKINTSNLKSGIYLVKISDSNKTSILRVVKR